ncbi:hypothetical protein K493DRAFT_309939 [Basidiobolus meristosporus CBS 931.73]|uniref:Mitochondrial ribosomal protein subunit L20 n=1 Tax=Basidiobolus meristosporus CBS 931.73 TaxID=1314790 RepID=A0A1Y1ZD82_9FUNG|nr:hypothetical protein K493DRAFT_309939 [Basidiobolus meristosporus CBS 931.73]|eukprot:ORY08134.1 hypothetical protein K493DRAFT_309939 [Basidiobolus meristosporus CBS 931.73]
MSIITGITHQLKRVHVGVDLTRRFASSVSTAPVYWESKLDDGSIFVSRVPKQAVVPKPEDLPPTLKPVQPKKYHLTDEDKRQIQELRNQNPSHWTRKRLAEKFDCSPLYISLIAPCPPERKALLEAEKEKKWSRMGYKRQQITINRQRRRELW